MAHTRKLLLIDDDEAVLALLTARLTPLYEVLACQEPHAALAMAREHMPDAILCDIDMPAMTGGEVSAALAADPACSRIPFVYLTALVTPEEARELRGQLGGRPGVSKRAPLGELVMKIEEVTARSLAA